MKIDDSIKDKNMIKGDNDQTRVKPAPDVCICGNLFDKGLLFKNKTIKEVDLGVKFETFLEVL